MDGDDFGYRFIFQKDLPSSDTEVKTFNDLIVSQTDHILYENGRTPIHTIAQALLMVGGKWLFNIFNPFFFIAFILLIVRYSTGKIEFHSSVLTVFLISAIPQFNQFFLWMIGCLNYLWSSVFVLIFLLLLEKRKENEISKRSWGVLLFAFFVGWTHEGITIPIALGFILAALPKWRKILKTEYAGMLLCFLVGAIICLSFTIYKAFIDDNGSDVITVLKKKFETGNNIMDDLHLLYALIVCCLIVLFLDKKAIFNFFRENVQWLLVLLFGIGIVYATGLPRIRCAYIVELTSMILLVRLYTMCRPTKVFKRILSTAMIIVLIILYSFVGYWTMKNYALSQDLCKQMEEGNTTVITEYLQMPPLIHNYTAGFSSSLSDITSLDPDAMENKFIAHFYHLPYVVFFPMKLLEDMAYTPEIFDEFTDCGYLPYYVKRKTDKETIKQVLYELRPAKDSEKPWWVRMTGIQRKMDSDIYLIGYFANVIVGEDEWICVQKSGYYDNRVKSILIQTKSNEKDIKNKKIVRHEDKTK